MYKQGKRVRAFGILVARKLRVAWLPEGELNAARFAAIVDRHFDNWAATERKWCWTGKSAC